MHKKASKGKKHVKYKESEERVKTRHLTISKLERNYGQVSLAIS